MYITTQISRIGVLEKPCRVCGEGLGEGEIDVKAIQKAYGGQRKEAPMVGMGVKLAVTVALMFIPVVGWAAALLINVPVVGDAIMGPIMKPLMGMMKKATHMESCMKWWTDSNIASMIAGTPLLPIGSELSREYEIQHAKPMSMVASFSESARRASMTRIFIGYVRANPDIMQYECATMSQGRAETGMTEVDYRKAQEYWGQMKEGARQKEYYDLVGSLAAIVAQKTGITQQTRQTGLVTGPGAFQLPAGVLSINRGAVVLAPGTSSNLVIDYGVSKPARQSAVVIVQPKATARL